MNNQIINDNDEKLNPFPLRKISQMSNISKCVNEFLKTTRIKVTSSSVAKNVISPLQETQSNDKSSKHLLLGEKSFTESKNRGEIVEFVEEIYDGNKDEEKIDENDERDMGSEREEGYETVDSNKKRVCFFEVKDDEENDKICYTEYRRTPRPRAPSIAVASSVPSFGRIVSSFESTDSVENYLLNGSSGDTNIPAIRFETDKNVQASNGNKTKSNFLNIPDVKKPIAAFYPRMKQHHELERKVGFTKPYEAKELRYSRKFRQWPKKSIVHVLQALKLMKTSQNAKRKVAHERNIFFAQPLPIHSFSPAEESSGSSIDHDLIDRSIDSRSDIREDESTSTSSTSSCSYSSVRKRLIKNSPLQREKNALSSSGLIEDAKIKFDSALGQTSTGLYDSGIDDREPENTSTLSLNKFEINLENLPQISGMYPRKKSDKCLACLHSSINKNPACLSKSYNFYQNVYQPASPASDELIIDELNHILRKGSLNFRDDTFHSERTSNFECSDIQSELFENNEMDEKTKTCRVYPSAIVTLEESKTRDHLSSNLSARKFELMSDKKSVVSSKSYMSTLSLASDRSKTTSDQEDSSDQAFEETGGMEEGIGESKSGLLAPCHAPLNFRPSLEPLKALRTKKARSIQSRMASLEKSTNIESDDKSEEDDILPIASAKINDNNASEDKTTSKSNLDNKAPADFPTIENDKYQDRDHSCDPIKGDRAEEPGEFSDMIDKFNSKDESFRQLVINEIEETVLRAKSQSRKSSTAEEIFYKLNIASEVLDHNLSDLFQPSSPIIADREIVEILLNLLNENSSFEKIMNYLASVFSNRIEKYSREQKSDTNKIEKVTKRLLALLVNSKLYLGNRKKSTDNNLSYKQKTAINSRQLRRVLPVKSYNLIAPILGIPSWHPKHWTSIKDARKLKIASKTATTKVKSQPSVRFSHRRESEIESDLVVHPPSLKKSALMDDLDESHKKKLMNPYVSFLLKPRREAIIWRPLTERDLEGYDPDATLNKRAAKVTDIICAEFCQWLRNLGGFDTTVDEEVLKDMFETDFTVDISKVMQMSQKELPVVPTAVAQVKNCPEAGELERTRRHLIEDAKAEREKTRLVGFGSSLPRVLKYVPPNNKVEVNWMRCENVPQDLESMEAVWKGITHLDSVKGFSDWLNINSMEPPEILKHPTRKTAVK
ncbi:uncharacterized protein LOC130662948 [Microplitis mediator]|uniref:uncharacterized protein LOC130662948 n=1 Tax=Microplitis mediator TaxID=375433 RepID=UPI0025565887|nr:uncharacterized protein LOC130662948 [Microplitis mediator]